MKSYRRLGLFFIISNMVVFIIRSGLAQANQEMVGIHISDAASPRAKAICVLPLYDAEASSVHITTNQKYATHKIHFVDAAKKASADVIITSQALSENPLYFESSPTDKSECIYFAHVIGLSKKRILIQDKPDDDTLTVLIEVPDLSLKEQIALLVVLGKI